MKLTFKHLVLDKIMFYNLYCVGGYVFPGSLNVLTTDEFIFMHFQTLLCNRALIRAISSSYLSARDIEWYDTSSFIRFLFPCSPQTFRMIV
jgi:hypothetical protein